jgi:hypothetical protein
MGQWRSRPAAVAQRHGWRPAGLWFAPRLLFILAFGLASFVVIVGLLWVTGRGSLSGSAPAGFGERRAG